MVREDDLDRFYDTLDDLETRVGGPRKLKNCTGYMDWPDRGVYFFLEPGETRESTDQPRVTRVGTHAVSTGSNTTLWDRLKQHYGTGDAPTTPTAAATVALSTASASARRLSKSTAFTKTIPTGTSAGRVSTASGRWFVTKSTFSNAG